MSDASTPLLADRAVTPAALLERVASARQRADRAEVEVLELALEWARAHPGRALLRDALVLAHRLPLTWARTRAGRVPVWRARRIAQAVLGAPVDVVAHIDQQVADIAHKAGLVTLDRLLEEAMLRLHPEQHKEQRLQALHARGVRLDTRAVERAGIAQLHVGGDFKGPLRLRPDPLRHRRTTGRPRRPGHLRRAAAKAVGVLADPARAALLLDGRPDPATPEGSTGAPAVPGSSLPPRKRAVLYLHLHQDALRGATTVGRVDNGGARPISSQVIREWLGSLDTEVVVKPVIDLTEPVPEVDAYQVPDRMAEHVRLRDTRCVFPHCSRLARGADLDHIHPHADGGPTSDANLAPLCRHDHRLKTLAGWRYQRLGPRTYLWTDPHGRQYLSDAQGTYPIPAPDRPQHESGSDPPAQDPAA